MCQETGEKELSEMDLCEKHHVRDNQGGVRTMANWRTHSPAKGGSSSALRIARASSV